MNARTLRLGLAAVAVLAWASWAPAQDQDAYLQRYGIALDGLRGAVDTIGSDPVAARGDLDRAFNALLTLARDASTANLVTALERVFERARTAIANGSADDLAVQVAVLEGGFQRLAYESALTAAVAGDLATARGRLDRIAADVGFADTDRLALADPAQPAGTLRFLVEAGVADVMRTRLAVARELAASNPGAAYRSLARAYGHFLLVQDSPRAAAGMNQGFVEAATSLVQDDPAGLIATLEGVEASVVALGEAARERRASVPGGGASATTATLLPPADGVAVPADAADTSDAPAATSAAATEGDAEAAEAGNGVISEAEFAALLLAREEAARRERLDALEAELLAAGMIVAPARADHANRLLDAGHETLASAIDALAARAATATAAAQRGDAEAAAEAVRAIEAAYGALLAPVVRARAAELDTETAGLVAHLAATRPLRVQDAAVLAGQVDALRAALDGAPVAAPQRGARTTTTLWAGLTRDVATFAIGLLALLPLFLLNVAFGGGNRHWQSIGVALFLLLLPVLFEGVIGLGGLLATVAGVDLLVPLTAYSVVGHPAAQVVWAATTLLAVVFATSGLVGISRQFGLLGGRRPAARAGATASTTATRTGTNPTAATVDWDDEL